MGQPLGHRGELRIGLVQRFEGAGHFVVERARPLAGFAELGVQSLVPGGRFVGLLDGLVDRSPYLDRARGRTRSALDPAVAEHVALAGDDAHDRAVLHGPRHAAGEVEIVDDNNVLEQFVDAAAVGLGHRDQIGGPPCAGRSPAADGCGGAPSTPPTSRPTRPASSALRCSSARTAVSRVVTAMASAAAPSAAAIAVS